MRAVSNLKCELGNYGWVRWTEGETRALLELRSRGITRAQIAKELGKSQRSVKKRLDRLARLARRA